MLDRVKAWWLAELTQLGKLITVVAVSASTGALIAAAAWLLTHGWSTNWDAVGALASAAAAIIAVAASVAALRAPQKQQAQDRTEATREILNASGEAVLIFRSAVINNVGSTAAYQMRLHAVKARHIRNTLDRLLDRPILTDGAIITGEGAMSLMAAIVEQEEEYNIPSRTAMARIAANHLQPAAEIEKLVTDRARRVASYAVARRWPKWERRFANIADKGLIAALADEEVAKQAIAKAAS